MTDETTEMTEPVVPTPTDAPVPVDAPVDVAAQADTPAEPTPAEPPKKPRKPRKKPDPNKPRKERWAMSGQQSLFRNKVRAPVSITLTQEHHDKVNRNMARLKLTRSDFLGLLVEKCADSVKL